MPLDILAHSPSPAAPTHSFPASLAATAEATLRAQFRDGGHFPSDAQWDAILDLLDHLERAANDDLSPAVYVSAIPAGTGKSASLAAFASALMDSPAHRDVGMLILCNRVSEVGDMAGSLMGYRDRLCVVAARQNAAALALGGQTDPDRAQLVVSTQAALRQTLRASHDFSNATRFHFRGKRRAVVAWDEAIAFSRAVVINADTASSLSGAGRLQNANAPEAADALLEWSLALSRAPEGQLAVPDFEDLGVDFRLLEDAVGDRDELVAASKALAIISGGTGCVIRDNTAGRRAANMISCVPELPSSLLPVLVTDASAAIGVHHAAYELMAANRRVVRLKEAAKTYGNFTVRIVPTAASRSTYHDRTTSKAGAPSKARELVDMAVRYARSVAPAEILFVSYKTRFTFKDMRERTIAAAIDARLTEPDKAGGRIHHLTYGQHTATNEFKNVRHVMLMGLNFLPRVASHAATGAALDKPMRTTDAADHPSETQITAMRLGMLRDATLQALLRGHARMGDNGDCGVMEAIVLQTRQTGLSDDDWRGMFPGVQLVDDRTLMPQKPLRGKLKELSDLVSVRLAAGEREMSNPTLCGAMGMHRTDFAKLVKRPEWGAYVAGLGLVPCRLKGNVTGLRAVA
jgi:hypothetical protein